VDINQEHMHTQSHQREVSIHTIKRTQQWYGTVRARDVRRDRVPQAIRATGGFVHLVTKTTTSSAVSTATAVAAITTRATLVALRLAFASSAPEKWACRACKNFCGI
jgi:hypothetical protein